MSQISKQVHTDLILVIKIEVGYEKQVEVVIKILGCKVKHCKYIAIKCTVES